MVNSVPSMPDSNGSAWIANTNLGLDTINANFTYQENQIDTIISEVTSLNTISNKTGAYTLQASDENLTIVVTGASASTITVPYTLPTGFACKITQAGAGIVTVTGDGTLVVYNADSHTGTAKQYASVSIEVIATNVANLEGYTA